MTGRVAVVGAGAVGATAALDLAQRGHEVHLFERGADPSGSTPRAAGVVYDAFAEDVDARVADRAVERFRAFSDDDDFAFELVSCPYVWLARPGDDRNADAIRTQVERMRANGRDVELLAPGDLADRFPAVRADDVAVAAVAHDAGHTDPGSYAAAMVDRATSAGVRSHFGRAVGVGLDPPRVLTGDAAGKRRGSEETAHEFDALLVAAGAHTGKLLSAAGVPLALKAYRVQALTAGVDGAYDRPTVYDATGGFYVRPHPAGLLAGDGTEPVGIDPDGYDPDADPEFRREFPGRIRDRLSGSPSLGVDRAWAGLCTATPDRNPLLGAVGDGVYVAAGWHGHGFMRAPATAEAIAETIAAGERAPIPAFDPGRFDGDESFEVVEGMTIDVEDPDEKAG